MIEKEKGQNFHMWNKEYGRLLGNKKTKLDKTVEIFLFPPELDFEFINQIVLFYPDSKEPGYLLNFTFQNNNKWVKIGDIRVPKGSREGFGTVLVETLLKLTEENNIQKIWGNLSYDDEDHKKIQVAFYKKLKFTVHENEDIIEK